MTNNPQLHKRVTIYSSDAYVDNAALSMTTVDMGGYNNVGLCISLLTTDIGLTVLKAMECDTVDGVATDITGATFDGGTDIFGNTTTLPGATSDGGIYALFVRPKKRFVILAATAGNGSVGTKAYAWAELFNSSIPAPANTVELGYNVVAV